MLTMLMATANIHAAEKKSLYDYSAKTIDGREFSMDQLKGKKVLIVNTASECGLTPQYEDLQKLYEKYEGDDFEIIGFPSNDFMNQEPGNNEEIKNFCQVNYGVTFQMMEKIKVKGDDMHPIYKWLTEKDLNGLKNSSVRWNFQKYLIDENGQLVDFVPPRKKPDSEEIVQWLEK